MRHKYVINLEVGFDDMDADDNGNLAMDADNLHITESGHAVFQRCKTDRELVGLNPDAFTPIRVFSPQSYFEIKEVR